MRARKRLAVVVVLLMLLVVSPITSTSACENIPSDVEVIADCIGFTGTIKNTGEVEGPEVVSLYFNGELVASRTFTVGGTGTLTVTYTWEELGITFDPLLIHTVTVWTDDDTDTFTFGPCEEPPPPCESELIAGQHSTAGTVRVWDDGVDLHVEYVMDSGWSLMDTHLYVGTEIPKKHAPGKFPYSGDTHYIIPLAGDCGDLFIAAHAVVTGPGGEETAWGDTYGTEFPKSWAMYFGYNPCSAMCFQP
jgi:hypothetical protein